MKLQPHRRAVARRAALAGIAMLTAAVPATIFASGSPPSVPPDGPALAELTLADNPGEGITSDEIRLGYMGDITGPTAANMEPYRKGIVAYFDHVNAAGGVAGRQLVLIAKDDQFTADRGVVNYRQLVGDEKVLAILNNGATSIMQVIDRDIQRDRIPMIGPYVTSDLSAANPFYFNLQLHYADQAEILVGHIAQQFPDGPRVVSVTFDVPSGAEFSAYLDRALAAHGGTLVGNVKVAVTAMDAVAPVVGLQRLLDSGDVDYIVWHGSGASGIALLKEMDKVGITTPLAGIYALTNPSVFTQIPPDIAATTVGVQTFMPASSAGEGGQILIGAVTGTEYESMVDDPNFVGGWVAGELAVQGLARLAEESGDEPGRVALADAMRTTFTFDGLTCDRDFTQGQTSPCGAMFAWDGSTLVPIDDFAAFDEYITGDYNILGD